MLSEGKIDIELLKKLLEYKGHKNNGIVTGPAIGMDAAVLASEKAKEHSCDYYGVDRNTECFLILKSDPITFPTSNPGKHLVIVNSNDIVTQGALPFGILTTMIIPVNTKKEELLRIQSEIDIICKELGISVLGGHTEVSSSVNSIILSGMMIGYVPKSFLPRSKPKDGDIVLQFGWTAIEGTSIIATEGKNKLSKHLTTEEINNAIDMINLLDISKKVLKLNLKYKPKMIHDCTEGGVLGALYEMLENLETGAEIMNNFPINQVTEKICSLLKINPLRLISSGTFIAVVDPEKVDKIKSDPELSLPIEVIGRIQTNSKSIILDDEDISKPKPDELIKALKEIKNLWFYCMRVPNKIVPNLTIVAPSSTAVK